MSFANDNYYCYTNPQVAAGDVTWLECAAASVCWSTLLVCYMEEPYGHLMLEKMQGVQARTHVRGNLFSFVMPWEDIAKCCEQASAYQRSQQDRTKPRHDDSTSCGVAVPLSEDMLATLVNVHIVGGSKDLAKHLPGVTMRVDRVLELIELLRESGYAGYEEGGVNSREKVRHRMRAMYEDKYGYDERFIPKAVQDAIDQAYSARLAGPSLVLDKSATPSEPAAEVKNFLEHTRPSELVAQRSVQSTTECFNETKYAFSKYQDLHIQTGSTMLEQFDAPYIGMANMYAMPVAVGGVGFPGKSPWRRFTQDDLIQVRLEQNPVVKTPQVSSALVDLFAFLKGTSRHILGQFRRNWSYSPGVFNLWFRSEVNLGTSLRVSTIMQADRGCDFAEEDAAVAASNLYKLLDAGFYFDSRGKRKRINNDVGKLMYAENITSTQKALLADMKFRTRSVPGTLEIRNKIGRTGFWASVVYGNGIFMTVSPGERHNYLAIRLSRYRSADPYVTHAGAKDERSWIGADRPSLEPFEDHVFGVHVPGYDMRRKIQAKDPLCCSNAFFVQIRTILATIAGIRMCQDCPHCAESDFPCQDAFGSSAELVGGFAGRADALFGAVEAQKTNGSLHFHFKLFVQRLHQYCTLKEIADLIEKGLASLDEFKQYSFYTFARKLTLMQDGMRRKKKTSKFTGHALTRTATPPMAHASGATRG